MTVMNMTLRERKKAPPTQPERMLEIFLQPGEFYWGNATTRIRTILGSCVGVTIWNPGRKVGGMCHIMLPTRTHTQKAASCAETSGKYADEAIALMMEEMAELKIKAGECQVKVFGGSNMFSRLNLKTKHQIGDRNLEAVLKILKKNGFDIHATNYGGEEARYVVFDVWSGDAWVRGSS